MSGPTRNLILICLATASWAFQFTVGTQVVSHWLRNDTFLSGPEYEDQRNTIIGLVNATYYLGLGLTALTVPWMMRRWGKSLATLGMILSLAYFVFVYRMFRGKVRLETESAAADVGPGDVPPHHAQERAHFPTR